MPDATQVLRIDMAHFLNTTPDVATKKFNRIGTGHASLSTSYNAETETQQWIDQRTGSTYLKNYAPTIATNQVAYKGDPVFDFVDDLSFRLAVGSDAETDYVEARIYNATGTGLTSIPARMFRVSIVIDSEGDAATDPLARDYAINFLGDPVIGTFDLDTLTFTSNSIGA